MVQWVQGVRHEERVVSGEGAVQLTVRKDPGIDVDGSRYFHIG